MSVYPLIQELQELHSAMEEAKADIVGLWALKFLIKQVSKQIFWSNVVMCHFEPWSISFNLADVTAFITMAHIHVGVI